MNSTNTTGNDERRPLILDHIVEMICDEIEVTHMQYAHVRIFDGEDELQGTTSPLAVLKAAYDCDSGLELFSEEAGGSVWVHINLGIRDAGLQPFTFNWYVG